MTEMRDMTSAHAEPRMHANGSGSPPARPVRTREQEALLALLRSADLAKHRYSGLFASEGITFQQYNVMRILRRFGPRGLPTLEVGGEMIERTPGVTRILDRLEAKGLVLRVRLPDDRRRVWCRISPQGMELLERLDEPVRRTDVGIFEGMPPDELDNLKEALERLHARLAAVG
jgi:DNA-binding MarR family transcriptional regulator